MKKTTLIIATIFGLLSIILGAFGAHAFKEILSSEKLQSFETGVRYQMFAAIFLLVIGAFLSFKSKMESWVSWLMIVGCVLFSFSIYLLSFQEIWGVNLKFLGPITPLGGLSMILSWVVLLIYFLKSNYK
ncbi:MAG: DUF423 domain-containing protein [Bacteroidetes bacterium]|nr:DUF423 domain-containing protein [Bacteroidota bacterium]